MAFLEYPFKQIEMTEAHKTSKEIITPLQELQQENRILRASFDRLLVEKNQIEKKAHVYEEKLNSLFNNSPLGIAFIEMILDDSGNPINFRYHEANDASKKILGIDLQDKIITEVFPGIKQHQFDWFGKAVKAGEQLYFEQYFESTQRWYQCVICKSNNNHFAFVFQDISDRKLTDDALKKSQLLLSSSLESHKDTIIFSLDKDYRYLYFNQAHLEGMKYSYNKDIKLGMCILDCVTSKDVKIISVENYARALKGESHSRINRFGENEFEYYETFYDPIINEKNKVVGITVFARNITEQLQIEQELLKAKENAEESNRLKSAFLANISHEIRTPMNGILGFTGLLKNPRLSGENQQKYIKMIETGGERMLNIINDLIDISKIESGQANLIYSQCDINKQCELIFQFFKPEVNQKGIRFTFQFSLYEKESIINTDAEKIYAILSNLVKNAIKYSDGGVIKFGYHLNKESEPRELVFFVKDTGIGISKDKIEFIFDRFIQVDSDHKRAYQGAGLGLSIAKGYVEMLGGKIWVESELGKGSTFYFTIPYNNASEEITKEKKDETYMVSDIPLKKLKLLIVEDDELSSMFQTEIATDYCSEILYAVNGIQAVEICRKNPDIDIIMMDIQMPIMDGHEATLQIRKFNKDVIIIAQTAHVFDNDREKAISAGCNGFLTKPLSCNFMRDLVKKYF